MTAGALLVPLVMAAASATTQSAVTTTPVLAEPIAQGPAAAVLEELSRRLRIPLAMDSAALRGLTLGPLPRGQPVPGALARTCRAAGLSCRILPLGLIVTRAPRRAAPAKNPVGIAMAAPPDHVTQLVVTGRRAGTQMTDPERSFSLSTSDSGALGAAAPRSMAELLRGIPGLWVDTSAGISANNVRVRGMPLDGYGALAVEENDLPIQHATLPWTDVDAFVRPDLMLTGVDYVRGGPSAVLASNAPGGILNLRLRSAPAMAGGSLRLTTSSRGLARAEGWTGAPLGDWRWIIGGGMTRDPTERKVSRTLGGGQLRLGVERDGSGARLRFMLRLQDDATLNTSSVPLTVHGNGHLSPVAGFDPRRGSWFGPDLDTVRFASATRAIGRNDVNRLVDGALTLEVPMAAETRLVWRGRLRHSLTERNAILSSGAPETADNYLADVASTLAAAWPGASAIALRQVDSGKACTLACGNGLVAVVQPTSATVALDETIHDLAISRPVSALGQHQLTLGLYGVANRWHYQRIVARALVAARSQGSLLDVVAVDGSGGRLGSLTDAGFLSRSSTWEETLGRTADLALYGADEWHLAPEWRIDWGLRHERTWLRGLVGVPATVDLSDGHSLGGKASQIDSGLRNPYASAFAATNATLALDWHKPGSANGLFLRATRSHILPSIGAYRTSTAPASAHVVGVSEAEWGAVHDGGRFHAAATLFANRFTGLDVSASTINASGAIVTVPRIATSAAIGLEAEMRLIRGPLSATGSLTWQKSRLANDRYSDASSGTAVIVDNNGHVPQRTPDIMGNAAFALTLPGTPLTLALNLTAMGRRYADDANSLALPGFVTTGLQASAGLGRRMQASLRISNLFDTLAVMQGDAIAGSGAPTLVKGIGYTMGRTLPGRMAEASLTYEF